MQDPAKAVNDILDRRERDSIALTLSEALLLSLTIDTREMLLIARKNQDYIERTMKEMEHDDGNDRVSGRTDETGA